MAGAPPQTAKSHLVYPKYWVDVYPHLYPHLSFLLRERVGYLRPMHPSISHSAPPIPLPYHLFLPSLLHYHPPSPILLLLHQPTQPNTAQPQMTDLQKKLANNTFEALWFNRYNPTTDPKQIHSIFVALTYAYSDCNQPDIARDAQWLAEVAKYRENQT